MTCDRFRELISADLDGELDEASTIELDGHLRACPACVAYEDQARSLRRAMRLDVTRQPSDVPRVDVAVAGDLRGITFLRYALFVIGGSLILLNLDHLVGTGALEDHVSRHDGVFGTALGIGMASVAWRPQRAIGLIPITAAVSVLMLIVAIRDLVDDQATMPAEAVHVVELAGLVCLWVISGGIPRAQTRLSTLLAWRRRPTVPSWPTR